MGDRKKPPVKAAKLVTNESLQGEKRFFAEIAALLREGRNAAYTAVNLAMVKTYWEIGRRIVEQEQRGIEHADYGEYLIVGLARYLGDNFGRGFSESNLRNFRQFYLTFPDEIRYTLCSELGWSHIRLIMRLDDDKARRYYLAETREQHWSVRTLERNIRTGHYERLLSSQQPTVRKSPAAATRSAHDFIKDPYVSARWTCTCACSTT
ncbi:MAG: DUF1016 N-terminal domain-containing protein [Azoarcus sp.]|jgi:hypothetical protein|nr:DUF1016 N-terminal domain-containing protein [Azoarcus sp.]